MTGMIRKNDSFVLDSKLLNDQLKIDIELPKNYDAKKTYNVLYVLDGNIFFELVKSTARLLKYKEEIPNILIVGIGYPDDTEHFIKRDRDYLPYPNSENACLFLECLQNEIMPTIESKFAVNVNQCSLAGDSYSGLFALYVLFNKPELFTGFIIGSPSIYWHDKIIFDYEKKYAQNNNYLKSKVFLAVGALEATLEPTFANMVGNVEEMYKTLIQRQYSGLELTLQIFDNETHQSVIPATMSRGLRVIYNKESYET